MPSRLDKNSADMILVAQVIEAGSISAASKIAGLDRAALGRRLAAVEARLGLSLFDRSSQKIRLTNAGDSYFQCCRSIRDMVEHAESVVTDNPPEKQDVLRIHAGFEEAESLLAPIVRDFSRARYQIEVSVRVETSATDDFPRDVDLMLGIDDPKRTDLDCCNIVAIPRSLWASRDYLETSSFDGTPQSIVGLTCVSVAGASDGVQTWQLFNNDFSVELHIASSFRLPTLGACRDVCAARVGIAMLPDYLCRDAEKIGTLVRVIPDWSPVRQWLVALHPVGRQKAHHTKSFIEFCQRHTKVRRHPRGSSSISCSNSASSA